MVKCTFCGEEIEKGTGKIYVQVDGKRPYCYKLGNKWLSKINLNKGYKNENTKR